LAADDTGAMVRGLEALGVGVQTGADPWSVDGTGGHLRPRASLVDAGESALSARLLTAMAALGTGEVTVDGRESMKRRPMRGLVDALGDWGIEVHSAGRVPVTVMGRGGVRGGPIRVDCTVTSQFATALLVVSPMASEPTELRIDGLQGSKGYINLTADVMRFFGAAVEPTITGYRVEPGGYRTADFVVEADASAAVYPMLAAAITGGRVEVQGLRADSGQPDIAVAGVLEEMGCRVDGTNTGLVMEGPADSLHPFRGDLSECPDGSLAIAVAALFADGVSELRGLGSLRHKESDRIESMVVEMTGLGAEVTADDGTLRISPGTLRPGTIDPHGDHRIAMSLATIGLVVDGIEMAQPHVVEKTWPEFWTMLDRLSG
jgi:3-phosphoshikimate 1-carboxyvinyltransferase